jgi:protein translocase SecG subunit
MAVVFGVIQVVASAALIALILMQTTKSEQSSGQTGMGWGVIGGKSQSAFRTRWGVEQHMERITTYVAVAFLLISLLAAIATLRRW